MDLGDFEVRKQHQILTFFSMAMVEEKLERGKAGYSCGSA